MASVTENGWPYVQHRGGQRGFVVALSPARLAFADYGGNRQLITAGNVAVEPRVSLFFMDYPGRRRLKILARAEVLDAREQSDLVERTRPSEGHGGPVERIVCLEVHAFDWNCPKFITERYTHDDIAELTKPLHERLATLEAELAKLRLARPEQLSQLGVDGRGEESVD